MEIQNQEIKKEEEQIINENSPLSETEKLLEIVEAKIVEKKYSNLKKSLIIIFIITILLIFFLILAYSNGANLLKS